MNEPLPSFWKRPMMEEAEDEDVIHASYNPEGLVKRNNDSGVGSKSNKNEITYE
jgi:hypothetical protein